MTWETALNWGNSERMGSLKKSKFEIAAYCLFWSFVLWLNGFLELLDQVISFDNNAALKGISKCTFKRFFADLCFRLF